MSSARMSRKFGFLAGAASSSEAADAAPSTEAAGAAPSNAADAAPARCRNSLLSNMAIALLPQRPAVALLPVPVEQSGEPGHHIGILQVHVIGFGGVFR